MYTKRRFLVFALILATLTSFTFWHKAGFINHKGNQVNSINTWEPRELSLRFGSSSTEITTDIATKLADITNSKSQAEMRQLYRRQQMRDVCQHLGQQPLNFHGNQTSIGALQSRLSYCFFNDDFRFILSFVYKVGSNSWRQLFNDLFQKSSNIFRGNQKLYDKSLWATFHEEPTASEEIDKRLQNYTNVIFVRHPFTRLISVFTYFLQPTNNRHYTVERARKILHTLHGVTFNDTDRPVVTFVEFLQFLADEKYSYINNGDLHWRPLLDIYQPCDYYYDFIGHMETLQEDVYYLFKLLKISDIVNFSHKNANKNVTCSNLQEYFALVSEELFQKLVYRYENDFKLFGYHVPRNKSDLISISNLQQC